MSIDVDARTVIGRRREEVAGFVMDAGNDTRWIGGIKEVRVLGEGPVSKGTQVERVATFLGRRIEYVNEVVVHEPPARLVMRSVRSPFPMRVSYEFEDLNGKTAARVRVEGTPEGFYRVAEPFMARAVRRSITRDLETLKRLLEGGADRPAR